MSLAFLVGGMPRGGTTLVAKFLSLHPQSFCYAGETHLLPLLHGMFADAPCHPQRLEEVIDQLRRQLREAMLEMPRFSVERGAHPGNLLFCEADVERLCGGVRQLLGDRLHGLELHRAALVLLDATLARVQSRPLRGEKTPSNLFAMARYPQATRNVLVGREPLGFVRSARGRVQGADPFAAAFEGSIEASVGLYLDYAHASRRLLQQDPGALWVRFEDLALAPAAVLQRLHDHLGLAVEERALRFVEQGNDPQLEDRAPFRYRRPGLQTADDFLSPEERWKLYHLTRSVREPLGYDDAQLRALGFAVPAAWPGGALDEAVLPLYGFGAAEAGSGARSMGRRGALLLYCAPGRRFELELTLVANLPESFAGPHRLQLQVGDRVLHQHLFDSGLQCFDLQLELDERDLTAVGDAGSFAIVELECSSACCPLAHDATSPDGRELSVQLHRHALRPSDAGRPMPGTRG